MNTSLSDVEAAEQEEEDSRAGAQGESAEKEAESSDDDVHAMVGATVGLLSGFFERNEPTHVREKKKKAAETAKNKEVRARSAKRRASLVRGTKAQDAREAAVKREKATAAEKERLAQEKADSRLPVNLRKRRDPKNALQRKRDDILEALTGGRVQEERENLRLDTGLFPSISTARKPPHMVPPLSTVTGVRPRSRLDSAGSSRGDLGSGRSGNTSLHSSPRGGKSKSKKKGRKGEEAAQEWQIAPPAVEDSSVMQVVRTGDVQALTSLRNSLSASAFSEAAMSPDAEGWLPIHVASSLGFATVVNQLLSAGMSMTNAKLKDGRRPLHLSAQGGHGNTLAVLLRNGAEVLAMSGEGTHGDTLCYL